MKCKYKRSVVIMIIAFIIFGSCFFINGVEVKASSTSYTHAPVFQDAEILNGIDVSEWQGSINWSEVKKAGIDFAFIRVGSRSTSLGTLNADKFYKKNIEEACKAGVDVGVFFFHRQ